MRLVSYNILDGGEGRADPLAEVILAGRPDVVALVEADDPAVLDRLSMRLKMDLIHAPGNRHASALLSRWPIRETINHAPAYPELSKSLLEAVVVDPSGKEWVFGVVHLHAHALEGDEARRERELAVVLDVFAPRRKSGTPHVICGDFNANAPYQQIDPSRAKQSTRADWEKNGGHAPRRVVQRMLDAGYRDALREVDPKAAETVGTFSTQYPEQRVDYCFLYGFDRPRVRAAWVEQDRLAKYASDHFPVGVEIV